MTGGNQTMGVRAAAARAPHPPRAYLLIEVRDGRIEEAKRTIERQPGVVSADMVAGPPDLLVITEADEFEQLVRQSVSALVSVEDLTVSIRCLPVKTSPSGSSAPPSTNGGNSEGLVGQPRS